MINKKKILIIDDEFEMLTSIEKILNLKESYSVIAKQNSKDAIKLIKSEKFDLIITDLKMKDFDGIEILKTARDSFSDSKVIVISGYGTVEASVEAMRKGAFDFIEKPFTSAKLYECVSRALNENDESAEKTVDDNDAKSFEGIIYNSIELERVIQLVKKIAPGNMNILITGESGTGKEMFARAIHNISKGSVDPFVAVNCGALPEHLFESELFGHEKGAFTGAIKTKPGLLEFANNGTFFFDEIAEMSEALQVKLLRMLEDRKIRRVGGQKEIEINVRIIAATNKDLLQAVNENKFREDLYYRLNTLNVHIPPLRERKADILTLTKFYLNQLCENSDGTKKILSKEAVEAIENYSWAGNVRELSNLISRAYFLCNSEIISVDDLPLPHSDKIGKINEKTLQMNYKDARNTVLEKFEIEYLTYHLRKNNGNISKTAAECGIDRRSIHRLLNKYNIIYKNT
ncbi:MAG: sigma-54-dependent Fis family transcriptional regulator [Ignavibacteriae bacterium]|nr:sigma-54-dependent Fis family transcriptional regulator [Ignavibacteriota bacterium]NOG99424.1 sigma-54-dependent Fis family transcriptional regulator [Ignavibacteriota bacterium]